MGGCGHPKRHAGAAHDVSWPHASDQPVTPLLTSPLRLWSRDFDWTGRFLWLFGFTRPKGQPKRAPRGNRNGPLRAGRIEWWGFSEAHSAIYPLISPNLGELGTLPSARDGMRDGAHTHTRHLGPPPPISLKFDREAAYRIRTARNRREPAPAAPLTAPILTRRARFRALAP